MPKDEKGYGSNSKSGLTTYDIGRAGASWVENSAKATEARVKAQKEAHKFAGMTSPPPTNKDFGRH